MILKYFSRIDLQNKKAFTMIELIFVIVVLGILAVTALPKFVNIAGDAKIASEQGIIGSVRTGINDAKNRLSVKHNEKQDLDGGIQVDYDGDGNSDAFTAKGFLWSLNSGSQVIFPTSGKQEISQSTFGWILDEPVKWGVQLKALTLKSDGSVDDTQAVIAVTASKMSDLSTCKISGKEVRWYYKGPATGDIEPLKGLEIGDDIKDLNKNLAWMYAPCRNGNLELVVTNKDAAKADGTKPYKTKYKAFITPLNK